MGSDPSLGTRNLGLSENCNSRQFHSDSFLIGCRAVGFYKQNKDVEKVLNAA